MIFTIIGFDASDEAATGTEVDFDLYSDVDFDVDFNINFNGDVDVDVHYSGVALSIQ